MNPVLVETILQLIVQDLIPLAEQVWKMFSNPAYVPTQADWDALKLLSQQTARTRMLDALKSNGIDPASPQGVALLALTP